VSCAPEPEAASCDPSQTSIDRAPYAACLDSCPGATAIDGASCPEPSTPGVVCEETHKPNAGGIAGGALAVAALILAVALVTATDSLFSRGFAPGAPRP
jgi:hypothetical protein